MTSLLHTIETPLRKCNGENIPRGAAWSKYNIQIESTDGEEEEDGREAQGRLCLFSAQQQVSAEESKT